MPLMRYRPASPLDRYIDCFWWSHRNEAQHHGEHMLPSGGVQLLFALHQTPILCSSSATGESIAWSGSMVHGPQSRYFLSGAKPKGAFVGVAFRPGAGGAVLGASMAELADRHVGLDAIWGARGRDLQERLMSMTQPTEIFRVLEESLSARIYRPLLMHPAVAQALASRSAASPSRVADLQQASGYSPKHFIAVFRSAVGLTPKQYFRIRRFNSVVRRIAAGAGGGLADLAAAAGYSDQAHMTREFREFAGVTPTAYRCTGQDSPLHHRVVETPARGAGK
jgi:AraC-like DNA-binding protein